MSSRSRVRLLTLAATAPLVAATAAWLLFAALELVGRTPFSYGRPANVAEAAALGEASEVMRLLSAGQNPTRLWDIGPHAISSSVTKVTALEAAVWSRRAQEMELFERAGAIVGDDDRRHLECLAADLSAEEVRLFLARGKPQECVPQAALEVVLARSRP